MKNIIRYTTKDLRNQYGLTQVQLSRCFGIPLRTVQNWDLKGCCPGYVYRMMSELLCIEFTRHGNFFVPMD